MAEFIYPLERLIEAFRKLPSVGQKTATRYALSLLKLPEEEIKNFSDAILGAKRDVHSCRLCHSISSDDICPICSNPERDASVICVVEDPQDVLAIERVRGVNWVYHVLGGVLNPRRQISIDQLNVMDLIERVEKGGVHEVILATNSTFEGDTTAMYLSKLLSKYPVKVTRLAYGIPVGGYLEYADDITLDRALSNRTILSGSEEQ